MKRIIKKSLMVLGGFIGVVCLISIIVGAFSAPTVTKTISMPESAYVNLEPLKYRDAMLNNYPLYKLFVVEVKILDICEENGKYRIHSFLETGDDFMLIFESKPKILKGDILQVDVQYLGLYQYTTVKDINRTVPIFHADHFSVICEAS